MEIVAESFGDPYRAIKSLGRKRVVAGCVLLDEAQNLPDLRGRRRVNRRHREGDGFSESKEESDSDSDSLVRRYIMDWKLYRGEAGVGLCRVAASSRCVSIAISMLCWEIVLALVF